jgi:hypothetical protein
MATFGGALALARAEEDDLPQPLSVSRAQFD